MSTPDDPGEPTYVGLNDALHNRHIVEDDKAGSSAFRPPLPPGSPVVLTWDEAVEIAASLLIVNEATRDIEGIPEESMDKIDQATLRQTDALKLLPLEVISAALDKDGNVVDRRLP